MADYKRHKELPAETRATFRDWLAGELAALGYTVPVTGQVRVNLFVRDAAKHGIYLSEVMLYRYVRAENPAVPTPEVCRQLALALAALGRYTPFLEVLVKAGYFQARDLSAYLEEYAAKVKVSA